MTANRYMPLRDVVLHTLRQAILRGEMEPSERPTGVRLARKLGVSCTSICKTICRLEFKGLITTMPCHGAEVAGTTEKNLRDVLKVRRTLGNPAVKLAAEHISSGDIERLEAARIGFREALGVKDMIRIVQTDEPLHDAIYASTYSDEPVQMLNNLRDQMYRYRLEYTKDTGKHQTLLHEHEQILTTMKAWNIALARQTMREHIGNQELTISRRLSEELLEKESAKRKETKKK